MSSTKHVQLHAQCKLTYPSVPFNENISWCAGKRNLRDIPHKIDHIFLLVYY